MILWAVAQGVSAIVALGLNIYVDHVRYKQRGTGKTTKKKISSDWFWTRRVYFAIGLSAGLLVSIWYLSENIKEIRGPVRDRYFASLRISATPVALPTPSVPVGKK